MAKKLSDKQKLRAFFRQATTDSPRVNPACRHFGECGGCEFQNIPYGRQLDLKQRAFSFIVTAVSEDFLVRAAACFENDPAEAEAARRKACLLREHIQPRRPDIIASPQVYGYRQRMDYVFAFGKAGLRVANRHRQVVRLEECPLLGERGFMVFQKALRLAEEEGLESYDYMRHHGELRYFVIRQSRSGGFLLSLVTKSRNSEEAVKRILARLVEDGDIVSGHWLLAEGLGDVSFGEALHHAGAPYIFERMNGVKLAIAPNTFFQSNPAVAEEAYARIAAFVPPGGTVLDMYSGVGSIAASVADKAASVLAVENVADNVAVAELNIAENQLSGKVSLIQEDAAAWLAREAGSPNAIRPDMLIVNPPRPGVDRSGMAAIRNLAPPRLAYLSCNPFSLLRDLAEVLDDYRLASLTLFDMFPQTRHFESLALLEKYR